MSDDTAARLAALEQLDEDLFDFPDVEGMAEQLAAARTVAAGGALPAPAPAKGKARAAADGEPKAPLPAPKAGAPASAERPTAQLRNVADSLRARPRNAADLDEDLFGFGELMELGAGSGLGPGERESTPALQGPSPLVEPKAAARAQKPARKDPVAAAPAPAAAPPAAVEPAPAKAREPKRKRSDAPPRAAAREAASGAASRPGDAPRLAEPSDAARRERAKSTDDAASPFLLPFPASVDLPPARSKLLWVLVGCFLLANGGVFLLTQQQSQSVNATLVAVTSTLAEAVARGSNAAPREASSTREPIASDVDPARRDDTLQLDPADFSSTNELGLHNARRLIEQGAYAEARRNLFFILANQDRSSPLTPALREDIDYLIALTYYDQGRSIAVEEKR